MEHWKSRGFVSGNPVTKGQTQDTLYPGMLGSVYHDGSWVGRSSLLSGKRSIPQCSSGLQRIHPTVYLVPYPTPCEPVTFSMHIMALLRTVVSVRQLVPTVVSGLSRPTRWSASSEKNLRRSGDKLVSHRSFSNDAYESSTVHRYEEKDFQLIKRSDDEAIQLWLRGDYKLCDNIGENKLASCLCACERSSNRNHKELS